MEEISLLEQIRISDDQPGVLLAPLKRHPPTLEDNRWSHDLLEFCVYLAINQLLKLTLNYNSKSYGLNGYLSKFMKLLEIFHRRFCLRWCSECDINQVFLFTLFVF